MFVILKVILSDVEALDVADALQKRFFGESSSFEVYLKTSEVRTLGHSYVDELSTS